jgi:hypothetical protein
MEFNYSYKGSSQVSDRADRTDMSFSPDTTREPTFFRGELDHRIPFREAISALHEVVVSDLRWKPKDRTEYKEWLARQEELDWALIAQKRRDVAREIESIQAELHDLNRRHEERWRAFYKARRTYFDYLYQKDRDAWFVLDPVITVHPDEIFFECFSQDESSYGRLGTSYEVYKQVGEFACGTTNVDYSQGLYDEFQKIRSYKSTSLEVDPSGFEVETSHEEAFKEVKIDLPDSWVRGFLQVSSAMSLAATQFDLHPMDVHNMCFVLRRNRELKGPRSMRFALVPGQPVKITFEPWNLELACPRSLYQGEHEREIRVWGRRRIHILERLVPIARRFTVHLLGTGMPSFYVADLGHMSFTLGLSGWTANDWSTAGNFDLMAPRAEVDDMTRRRVFEALKQTWVESPDSLAARLELDRSVVLGALAAYTQAGRAIYDLEKQVFRVRELSREPLPVERLRFASEREASASRLLHEGRVRVSARQLAAGAIEVQGVISHRSKSFAPELVIDADERLVKAECSCNFYQQNKLYKGPCEHILAARMAFARDRGAALAPVPGALDTPGPAGAQPGGEPGGEPGGGALRRLFDKVTGRERPGPQSAQLVDVALERAMRALIDRGLVEIATRRRDRLIEEMLAATFRARGLESAVELALGALLASELPEEIYGEDDELEAVLMEALESVQRAARDE